MGRRGLSILAACAALAVGLSPAAGAPAAPFSFAVIGDMPYGHPQLRVFLERISQINADPQVQLASHLGDISVPLNCSGSYYARIKSGFDQFADPLVYTPGDNEWADCHQARVGAGNPLDRLAAVRSVFFPRPGRTLGRNPAEVTPQPGYPENVFFSRAGITFGAVHMVGSSNDLRPWVGLGQRAPTAAQRAEVAARTTAGIALVRSVFAQAKNSNSRAVVLLTQADMFSGKGAAYRAGYQPLVRALAAESVSFGRPVYLFNGDSHTFRSDNPLVLPKWLAFYGITKAVPNLSRVTVQGGSSVNEWLRVTVVDEASVLRVERIAFR
ncbi:hypothetical protein LVY72_18440 [Arthrobacter sp. I2-34]|uniref:Calcineurin-like phosphoesterase domain-containing protein n=1 Tax=Arthrobacter hankyongi TaxID=2904801 RepID=A0ABS9LB25_9MICC|nr:hypothetical protein [Arthrobacter hankyongi]MCG2623877.1 hypothetical protein [Arthrobacter hankyongi]